MFFHVLFSISVKINIKDSLFESLFMIKAEAESTERGKYRGSEESIGHFLVVVNLIVKATLSAELSFQMKSSFVCT